jgi:hypothetical protein
VSVTIASALHELTASEIAAAVNAGRMTCEAVMRASNGMPIGIQLFAKRHDDRRLFANAGWVYRQLS